MSKLTHKRSRRNNWSELNQKLLEIIVSKLMNSQFPWQDIARFRSVCSSWKASVKNPKPGPLLLLPSEEDDNYSVQLGLFSVRDKKTWDLNWKVGVSRDISLEPEEVPVVGSSHGWMIMMDESENPYLYSLFSKKRIDLPGKYAIQQLVDSNARSILTSEPGNLRNLIQKAILTGNPSSSQDYMVVMIHNSSKKLAFWCKGDDSWQGFSDCRDYLDIVWSDSDETLYALRDVRENNGRKIEGWRLSGAFPTIKVNIQCPFGHIYADDPLNLSGRRCFQWTAREYLVPSKGSILFATRFIGEFVNGNGDLCTEGDVLDDETICYRTIKFRVFKVDMAAQKLEEVKSLQDEILFLGGNHGVSLPSVECRGFKPNSVYFTDDYWDRIYSDGIYEGHDFGGFCLEDGSVESVYESNLLRRFEPFPFWVLTDYY